uniref:NADH dehydrogenase subunit 6 n=1 Tax=Citharichthys arctifrons TaxID=1231344 RepID=UPI0028D069FB|nr:NADH dehydrogenase subunit 6 [Citharichthys arctifrons]WMY90186.1 NADH dehydrogenase subunit 6 [Citharichthys arctifrons]
MTIVMCLVLVLLILGVVAVASNPSPYFAALGLVVVAAMGCGLLIGHGGPFLSLVLFLIYLGGMLVVFAYAVALAAEAYPEAWGELKVLVPMVVYVLVLTVLIVALWPAWFNSGWVPSSDMDELMVLRGETSGVALMYSMGGWMLIISGWVLLLTLFVVLELTRGLSRGALRAV